jgi:hypothetical protein
MEPARARTKKGEAPQEDDTRLSARADDRGDAAHCGPETLADETRQQPLDETMLKVELHHILRLGLALSD